MAKNASTMDKVKGKLAAALDDSPGLLIATGKTFLYSIHMRAGGTAAFIQLFNAAALVDVTLGTTVPDLSLPVLANTALDIDLTLPLEFKLGLVVFSTTTATGNTGAQTDGSFFYA